MLKSKKAIVQYLPQKLQDFVQAEYMNLNAFLQYLFFCQNPHNLYLSLQSENDTSSILTCMNSNANPE